MCSRLEIWALGSYASCSPNVWSPALCAVVGGAFFALSFTSVSRRKANLFPTPSAWVSKAWFFFVKIASFKQTYWVCPSKACRVSDEQVTPYPTPLTYRISPCSPMASTVPLNPAIIMVPSTPRQASCSASNNLSFSVGLITWKSRILLDEVPAWAICVPNNASERNTKTTNKISFVFIIALHSFLFLIVTWGALSSLSRIAEQWNTLRLKYGTVSNMIFVW